LGKLGACLHEWMCEFFWQRDFSGSTGHEFLTCECDGRPICFFLNFQYSSGKYEKLVLINSHDLHKLQFRTLHCEKQSKVNAHLIYFFFVFLTRTQNSIFLHRQLTTLQLY